MTCQRTITGGGVPRRAWAAVLTLLAALAVLVHHDMGTAPAMPATAVMSAMPPMARTAPHGGTAQAADGSGHTGAGAPMAGHAMTGHGAPEATATGRGTVRHGASAPAVTSGLGHDADGPCSGAGMQHCTSGAVGTPQLLAPPAVAPHAVPGAPARGVLAGLGLPGHPHRAPPDLSVLSRLLI
ncbi:hypothetical protein FRZ03_33755 [Streptomyces misionensis]|uniref:Uncharacterized protein n=1 Tax=Streptomyces misionensis TaxID=67331 RepID=A0A5C6IUS2_9ACTN|nr:hypothetical protein [Streptomyces misionensis]TWV32045.1 hypothetical protein FRZ03_33755 [Streptomyces misionensis]